MSNNEIEKFEFGGNELRVVMIDNDPWFVAKDVTDMLGFKDGSQAVRQHVLPGQTQTRQFNGFAGRPFTLINEAGLYRLIMKSTLPAAVQIQSWITDEVMPTIRKTGGAYIKPGSQECSTQPVLHCETGSVPHAGTPRRDDH